VLVSLRPKPSPVLGRPIIPGAVQVISGYFPGNQFRDMDAVPLDALVDTGCAHSCIPAAVCRGDHGESLLRVVHYAQPRDWHGDRSRTPVPAYKVWVKVFGEGPFKIDAYETR
jgi:hypothetical protein